MSSKKGALFALLMATIIIGIILFLLDTSVSENTETINEQNTKNSIQNELIEEFGK